MNIDWLLDRPLSLVTRWHNRPHNGLRESVLEHAGHVARLAMQIGALYEVYCGPLDWRTLYEMALVHDDTESLIGDIPGSAKAKFPGLRAAARDANGLALWDIYKNFPDCVRSRFWRVHTALTKESREHEIVTLADDFSALSYAELQVKMGNTLFVEVAIQIRRSVAKALKELPWTQQIPQFADTGDHPTRSAMLGFAPPQAPVGSRVT